MFLFLVFSIFSYGMSLALGYGMSRFIFGKYYNITDGKRYGFEGEDCTVYNCELCYTDKILGFFGGCFVVGLLGFALIAAVIFMVWKVGVVCKYWLAMCALIIGDKMDGLYIEINRYLNDREMERKIAEKKRAAAEGTLTSSDDFEAAQSDHSYANITDDNFEEYLIFKDNQYSW